MNITRSFSKLLLACAMVLVFTGPIAAADSSDQQISQNVLSQLRKHSSLMVEPIPITVQTIHRITYLHGLVDTDLDRYLAVEVAQATPGVTKVVNVIAVSNK